MRSAVAGRMLTVDKGGRHFLVWSLTLLVSSLPAILWQEATGRSGAWLFWAQEGLLLGLLLASFVWSRLQAIRPYATILFLLYAAERGASYLAETTLWQGWFGGTAAPFTSAMLGIQLRRFAVTLSVIAALWFLGRERHTFFLTAGNVRAPAQPVRWLGLERPLSWHRFGLICTACISLGLLAFLLLAGRPAPGLLVQVVPFLPAILLFAALNAFSEEMSYRASLLATLEGVVGPHQALWLSATFFGLGHYYGVPYGVIGVLMATFLGWLLGKAMLETRGLAWPWFIHFVQDVWVFAFMAVGSITPGG